MNTAACSTASGYGWHAPDGQYPSIAPWRADALIGLPDAPRKFSSARTDATPQPAAGTALNEIQFWPGCSGREKQTAGGGYAGPLQAGGGGLGGAGADMRIGSRENEGVNVTTL